MNLEVFRGEKSQEKNSKKSFKSYSNVNRRSQEEVDADLNEIKKCLREIRGSDLTFDKKMDKILEINSIILPELFNEFSNPMPSIDRSTIGSRILSAVKDISNVLIKKREVETSDEIDPNSPKFQCVFNWFFEVINIVLERQGLDSIVMNNIFNDLSLELSGWEDKISKRLKGVSLKALKEVKNPITEKTADIGGNEKSLEGGFKL